MLRLLACSFLLLLYAAAGAAEVYKWTDDQGRTNFSDAVPENMKGRAKRVIIEKPSAKDVAAAKAEAAKERQRSAVETAQRNASVQNIGSSGSGTVASSGPDNCEAQWARYRASEECFGPYRLANGGIRAEAFQRCEIVPYPACAPGPVVSQ